MIDMACMISPDNKIDPLPSRPARVEVTILPGDQLEGANRSGVGEGTRIGM